jgi:hypothetical protein
MISLFLMRYPIRCIIFIFLAYFASEIHHNSRMSTSVPSSAAIRNASRRGNAATAHHQTLISRRTTITLSPEAQEIVERFKSASGASTSAAIDQIIQRSDPKPSRLKNMNGFLVIDRPAGSPNDPVHFTVEDAKRTEDEMDREAVERILLRKREPSAHKRKTGSRQ